MGRIKANRFKRDPHSDLEYFMQRVFYDTMGRLREPRLVDTSNIVPVSPGPH